MDIGRTCYSSWMNTPDAGRIRVRWYKIPRPEPGVYFLNEYSSSDWDEDPKSYDPDLGEESTTRKPYTDWRDCSNPPWDCPAPGFCEEFAERPPANILFMMDLGAAPYPYSLLNGTYLIQQTSPCFSSVFRFPGPIPTTGGTFQVFPGRTCFLNMQWTVLPIGPAFMVDGSQLPEVWADDLHWDGTLVTGSPPANEYPFKGRLIAFGCNPLTTESGRPLRTEDGGQLSTE